MEFGIQCPPGPPGPSLASVAQRSAERESGWGAIGTRPTKLPGSPKTESDRRH